MYPPIKEIKSNPTRKGQFLRLPGIVYSTAQGQDLTLDLLLPWGYELGGKYNPPKPLIVFVQGSAWTVPDYNYELLQLASFAKAGYVVAMVTHRNCLDGNPFPNFLIDVKCAIRFLRKNASVYCIDPDHVAIWGTSSGGNIAQLVGTTQGVQQFESSEHEGFSDHVNVVVSCFGPSDISAMLSTLDFNPEFVAIRNALSGGNEANSEELEKQMSPIHWLKEEQEYPPFLLMHGTLDLLVDYSQMESMYHRLIDCGVTAEAYRIEGAPHEDIFWSEEVYQIILEFIGKYV